MSAERADLTENLCEFWKFWICWRLLICIKDRQKGVKFRVKNTIKEALKVENQFSIFEI